jgi:prepilin-type N-terminal cleavage/methylation domain-containing protein
MSQQLHSIKRLHRTEGFTLVEVMLSMGIFAVGILAVAGLQFWTSRNNTTGEIMTQAAMLARAQIETLKQQADLGPLTVASVNDPKNPVDANGEPGGIFTRQWTVSDPFGAGYSTGARLVEVTVSWNRLGQNRNVVMTTIVRDRS